MGWREFVGDAGRIVGLDHYGASAAYTVLYEEFGLTAEAVVAAARESIEAAARERRPIGPGPPAPSTPPATADPTTSHRVQPERHCHGTEREAGRAVRRGVAVWLDDLSRDRIRSGNLQSLVDEYSRRRGHHQPDDLRRGDPRLGLLRRPGARAGDPRGERRGGAAHHHGLRRPGRLRPAAAGRTTGSRATAASPSRSRPAWRTTPTRPRPRPRTCGGWSTGRTSSSRSRRPRPACRRSPTRSPRASVSTSP